MSTSENVETAKKGYQAFSAGDVEATLGLFDDDCEWVLNGNSTISGTYRGKAEVMDLFGKLAEKSLTTAPDRFLADGNVVVVIGQVTAGGETGAEVDVLTFRGGKAVKVESFGDTAMQERVYGSK